MKRDMHPALVTTEVLDYVSKAIRIDAVEAWVHFGDFRTAEDVTRVRRHAAKIRRER